MLTRFALTAVAAASLAFAATSVRAADMVTTSASASPVAVAPGGHGTLTITLTFAPGAHCNANKGNSADFIPTTFEAGKIAGVKLGAAKFPAGVTVTTAGLKQVVYDKPTKITIPFTVAKNAKHGSTMAIGGKLTYQACNTAVCFPPKIVSVTAPIAIK